MSIGQPVVIENMPGAGASAAALALARAAPDGHAILWVIEPERDRAVDVQVAALRLVARLRADRPDGDLRLRAVRARRTAR